jgi:D-alanyl-D-alanine carboxypeptidase
MVDVEGPRRRASVLSKESKPSSVPVTRRHVLATPLLIAFAGSSTLRVAGASQGPVFQQTDSHIPDRRVALLQRVLTDNGLYSSATDGVFGPETTSAVMSFQTMHGIPADGVVSMETGKALGLPFWDTDVARRLNPPFRDDTKYPEGTEFNFRSLVGIGNFFSSQPDAEYNSSNTLTRRALRTNNPGALNISKWQIDNMKGYVGSTLPDRYGDSTVAYEAPEYGIGAWGFLLRKIYFSSSKDIVTVGAIVDKYRGPNSRDGYIDGYMKYSDGRYNEDYEINLYDNAELARFAIASYSFEFGSWYPLTDDQLLAGIAVTDSYIDSSGKDEVIVRPEEMDPTLYITLPEAEEPR